MTKSGHVPEPATSRRRRPLLIFLGNTIRQLRDEKGVTQRELAASLGLSASLLAKYEAGETEPPLRTLLRIAHWFQVPVGLIVDELHGVQPIGDAELLDRVRKVSTLGVEERQAAIAVLDAILGFRKLLTARSGGSHGSR